MGAWRWIEYVYLFLKEMYTIAFYYECVMIDFLCCLAFIPKRGCDSKV